MNLLPYVNERPRSQDSGLIQQLIQVIRHPVGFLLFTLSSVMSTSCLSRLSSCLSLRCQKLELDTGLVTMRVRIRASLPQTLNKILAFRIICSSLNQKHDQQKRLALSQLGDPSAILVRKFHFKSMAAIQEGGRA